MEYFGERINDQQLIFAKDWLKQTIKLWNNNGIVHGDIIQETHSFEGSSERYKINKNNILFNGSQYRLIDYDYTFNGKYKNYEDALNREKILLNKYFYNNEDAPGRPKKKIRPTKYKRLKFKIDDEDDHTMLHDFDNDDYLFSDEYPKDNNTKKKLFF